MLKKVIKGIAKSCGLQLLGHDTAFYANRSLEALLRQENINLVLDIGANTGQFAQGLRAWDYKGRIVSFEPLTEAHAQLCRNAKKDMNWMVAERTAIGAEKGSVDITDTALND
jgi:predicted RNA methylase